MALNFLGIAELLLLACAITATAMMGTAQASEVPPLPPQGPLPGIPANPLAAGCKPLVYGLGYACSASSAGGQPPELANLTISPTTFRLISDPWVVVLRDFLGWPYGNSPVEVNISMPAPGTLPGQTRGLEIQPGFRERPAPPQMDLSLTENWIVPVFYNRVDERWEPLDACTYVPAPANLLRCRPDGFLMRQYSGLRLVLAAVMSERGAAVMPLFQAAMQPRAPDARICVPSAELFSRYCPNVMAYSTEVRYGSNSLRSAMAGCNHPMCFLFPANMAHFQQGGCVYGFSRRCATWNECCPERILPPESGNLWDYIGSWSGDEDYTKARSVRFGMRGLIGYDVPAYTFASSKSKVVLTDGVSAPSDMPFPHYGLVLETPVNLAFEDVPTKPFGVYYKSCTLSTAVVGSMRCNQKALYDSTATSIFYYDAPTRRWVSVPILQSSGSSSGGGAYMTFNATDGSCTATVPPRVAIRNKLSMFFALVTGIPKSPDGSHLTATFFLPPTGLRKSDMYREGWSIDVADVGCNYLLPVRAGSFEEAVFNSDQQMQGNLVVVGSPGSVQLVQLPSSPSEGYNISLFVDPSLLLLVAPPLSRGRRRRLMGGDSGSGSSAAPVQVYANVSGGWVPVPGCFFNASTTSSECSIQSSFFQTYGLSFTLATLTPGTSSVATILQADKAYATTLENSDSATILTMIDQASALPATSPTPLAPSNPPATTQPPPATPAKTSAAIVAATTTPAPPAGGDAGAGGLGPGAVAGIVVGCLLAVAALGVAAYFAFFRQVDAAGAYARLSEAKALTSAFQFQSGATAARYAQVPALDADVNSFFGRRQTGSFA